MFILLFLFWLLMISSVTLETVIFGICLSALLYFLMYKLFGITPKKEIQRICLWWYAPAYAFLMMWEVLKANIAAVKVVFCKKLQTTPVVVHYTPKLKSEFAKTVLANSITLTPGTISLSVEDGVFTVHALNQSFADGLVGWTCEKFLQKIERKLGI